MRALLKHLTQENCENIQKTASKLLVFGAVNIIFKSEMTNEKSRETEKNREI